MGKLEHYQRVKKWLMDNKGYSEEQASSILKNVPSRDITNMLRCANIEEGFEYFLKRRLGREKARQAREEWYRRTVPVPAETKRSTKGRVIDALVAMGYSRQEISRCINKITAQAFTQANRSKENFDGLVKRADALIKVKRKHGKL